MASILIPEVTRAERKQAHLAVRKLYGLSLSAYLKGCLREVRNQARAKYPELFRSAAIAELCPMDRTIYRHLTEEGRRTVEDLVAELGLGRSKIRAALDRLRAAGLVDVLDQGGRIGEKRGARRQLYVSLEER